MFRENLYRMRPVSAAGYRLMCIEISLWFPIEGLSKRYDGRRRSEPFFRLHDPFEPPIVPLETFYDLEWVDETGHRIETKGEGPVRVTFPQRPWNKVLLRRLKRWEDDGAILFDRDRKPIMGGIALRTKELGGTPAALQIAAAEGRPLAVGPSRHTISPHFDTPASESQQQPDKAPAELPVAADASATKRRPNRG